MGDSRFANRILTELPLLSTLLCLVRIQYRHGEENYINYSSNHFICNLASFSQCLYCLDYNLTICIYRDLTTSVLLCCAKQWTRVRVVIALWLPQQQQLACYNRNSCLAKGSTSINIPTRPTGYEIKQCSNEVSLYLDWLPHFHRVFAMRHNLWWTVPQSHSIPHSIC